jgi:hypothetical protein
LAEAPAAAAQRDTGMNWKARRTMRCLHLQRLALLGERRSLP